jgi:hypothetical protein
MDIVDLPFVPIEADLGDALSLMRKSKRSGIISVEEKTPWLFKAGWIVIEITRGKKRLTDIERRWRIEIPEPPRPVEKMGHHEVESFLDNVSRHYMSFSREWSSPKPPINVKIVTRHERLARELSLAPSNCYCTNPNLQDDPHPYTPPLPPGNKCKFDGSLIVCV